MRAFSLLLLFMLVGGCVRAKEEPASPSQGKEQVYRGKTLDEWVTQARGNDPLLRPRAVVVLGEIGPTVIPALTELFKDERIRGDAEVAFGQHRFSSRSRPYRVAQRQGLACSSGSGCGS